MFSFSQVKKQTLVPQKQLAKDIKSRLNVVNVTPAGFRAITTSNVVALQSIWLQMLEDSGIKINVTEIKTLKASCAKRASSTQCGSDAAEVLGETSHVDVYQIQIPRFWLRTKFKEGKTSYRRTCSSPGVTVPGRITPVPLKVPSWTWKTGLRARPEDCNRVFNTSRGHVTIAPTVPLHLQINDTQKTYKNKCDDNKKILAS